MPSLPEDRGPAFPSTRWSRILARESPRDLEALAQAYSRPIHAYLATRFGLGQDDARDLAQEAFAWMLSTRFFERADPARGRFRGLLKKALARFATEHLRRLGADKRGGGHVHEPIDADRVPADPKSRTPDQVLDEAWRRELLERARELLEADLEASGRGTYYSLFRDYFLEEARDADGDDGIDYGTLAARYGITKTDVSNWLDYAKRRFRDLLRALVFETVSDDEEMKEEMRFLFGTAGARERERK